ncbi:P-loop containing nucleoside triphosphate hydrolase protein [Globomyces pollinis-pini]|nr:P-loop containing nucleoside triphosphate hydrolase protein [Globomyces pollinis-pini]
MENGSIKETETRKGYEESGVESPEFRTSYVSKMTYSWVFEFLRRGNKKTITFDDFWTLPSYMKVWRNCDEFEVYWDTELKKEKPSLLNALTKAYLPKVLFIIAINLGNTVLSFLNPLIIDYIINFITTRGTNNAQSNASGVIVGICFLLVNVLNGIIMGQLFNKTFLLSASLKYTLQGIIYRKTMKISDHDRASTGQILTLMTVDAGAVSGSVVAAMFLSGAPLNLILSLVILYNTVGWSFVSAIIIILISSPIITKFGSYLSKYRKLILKETDKRLQAITSAISGMKTVKLYGWAKFVKDRILKIREDELQFMKRSNFFNSMQSSAATLIPSVTTYALFATYAFVSTDNSLTSNKIFVTLSVIGLIQQPLNSLIYAWGPLVEAFAGIQRLEVFLITNDLKRYVKRGESTDPIAIEIKDGDFSFKEGLSVLSNLNLLIPRGKITAVVGQVGAGKTALIESILGELYLQNGSVSLNGTTAYVSQKHWIMNTSIRKNILFGRDYDENRYKSIIEACALVRDFEVFTDGDKTMIGERGVNLSGGQKARISCARALYADADIVLLDDPLSAVDAHVDRQMFHSWFNITDGILKNKTVVLVTHAVHHLSQMDKIVCIAEGRIVEDGSYQELVSQKGIVYEMVEDYMNKRQDTQEEEHPNTVEDEKELKKISEVINPDKKEKPIAVKSNEEKMEVGSVDWRVYLLYVKSCGINSFILYLMFLMIENGLNVSATYWLGTWGAASGEGKDNVSFYLGIYSAILMAIFIVVSSRIFFFNMVITINAARSTFKGIIERIFRLPMSFFDTTPSGRVLNRLGSDQKSVDSTIPSNVSGMLNCIVSLMVIAATSFFAVPWLVFVLFPLSLVFYYIQKMYLTVSREVSRINATKTSPVYSHFSESLEGLKCIRAFGNTNSFLDKAETTLDENGRAFYTSISTNRWLSLNLQVISGILLGSIVILTIITPNSNAVATGVAISYSLNLVNYMSMVLRLYSALENSIVSVERIKEYSELPMEADDTSKEKLDPNWPTKGDIVFNDFETTYREGLEPVLKDLSLNINGGDKIAIVGRTGAGKSSLTLALFRIIEATKGSITIDGVDIAHIGLSNLRTQLTILPQEPILFDANVRENLDPIGKHSDAELWRALQSAQLSEHFKNTESQLDFVLSESSLSSGQSQLLCLARAILRKTKVLVLDEATANVDHQTDDLVQKIIREEFRDCTVLTIAHRIGTVMDYDRILVLDQGSLAEFDSPEALLNDPNSIFYSLAKESGLV